MDENNITTINTMVINEHKASDRANWMKKTQIKTEYYVQKWTKIAN